MHTHSHRYSQCFFLFLFFLCNCILQQHIPLADCTTGMFFHSLDFGGLILCSVAIAPVAKALSNHWASGEDFSSQKQEARSTVRRLSRQLSQLWEASTKFWLPNSLFQQIHLSRVSINTLFIYIVFSLGHCGTKNLPRVTGQWQSRLLVQCSSQGLAHWGSTACVQIPGPPPTSCVTLPSPLRPLSQIPLL